MSEVDSRSFVERFLGQFGYERKRSVGAITPPEPPEHLAPPVIAHRAAREEFQYDRAKINGFSFSYHAGDSRFCYAIGKDDWIPVSIAAMMVGVKLGEALDLVSKFCARSLWLHATDPVYLSWVEANDTVFEDLTWMREANLDPVAPMNLGWPAKFALMSPAALSYEYRKCWQRVYVDMAEDWLSCSDVHADFAQLDVSRNVEAAVQSQLTILTEYAAVWFEARGMKVDPGNGLLNAPGYQALFFAADQEY